MVAERSAVMLRRWDIVLLMMMVVGPAPCVAGVRAKNRSGKKVYTTFFTIGDWGSGTTNHSAVAAAMSSWAAELTPDFVIALGDNIYEKGVQSVDDPFWQSRFEGVYTSPWLQVHWYAILGNHDTYGGHPEAEISYYTEHMDERWVMPSYFYTYRFKVPGGKTMQIIFLDTNSLAPKTYTTQLHQDIATGEAVDIDTQPLVAGFGALESRGASQWSWLKDTLASSSADWVLVAGHHPVFSASRHGDTPELKKKLKPLLEAYGVQAYMCGHDHVLQYLSDDTDDDSAKGGVNYYVSGAGGQDLYWITPTPQVQWWATESGFMVHQFSDDGTMMKVAAVGASGKVLFSHEVYLDATRRDRRAKERTRAAMASRVEGGALRAADGGVHAAMQRP